MTNLHNAASSRAWFEQQANLLRAQQDYIMADLLDRYATNCDSWQLQVRILPTLKPTPCQQQQARDSRSEYLANTLLADRVADTEQLDKAWRRLELAKEHKAEQQLRHRRQLIATLKHYSVTEL